MGVINMIYLYLTDNITIAQYHSTKLNDNSKHNFIDIVFKRFWCFDQKVWNQTNCSKFMIQYQDRESYNPWRPPFYVCEVAEWRHWMRLHYGIDTRTRTIFRILFALVDISSWISLTQMTLFTGLHDFIYGATWCAWIYCGWWLVAENDFMISCDQIVNNT